MKSKLIITMLIILMLMILIAVVRVNDQNSDSKNVYLPESTNDKIITVIN